MDEGQFWFCAPRRDASSASLKSDIQGCFFCLIAYTMLLRQVWDGKAHVRNLTSMIIYTAN